MRILLLSPHTDDVELGAGGSVAKFLEGQNELYWMVFSTAQDSIPDDMPKDTLRNEFISVAESIGLGPDNYKIYDYPVRYLFKYRQEILEEMIKVKKSFAPDLVIGPSPNDHHQDHEVISNEMIRAFKSSSSVLGYELPWNQTGFDMQLFNKLNERHVEKKLKLLSNYHSQLSLNRPYFSNEFIRGMAKMRGVQVQSDFAEAFEVIRWRL